MMAMIHKLMYLSYNGLHVCYSADKWYGLKPTPVGNDTSFHKCLNPNWSTKIKKVKAICNNYNKINICYYLHPHHVLN